MAGIKKKILNHFDKFYQSRDQNVKKPIGSGLGLAICKQIIEHHKGTFGSESRLEGGIYFHITQL
jgi:signal transduction histidine kinase